ncbi:MAG: hypothetical protein RLZZ528_92 [Pseudomonadota bacterium]|jgi:Ca2+/Na+ antiporter
MLQLLVFGFIALSVVYLLVSVYSRSVRREKLEKGFDGDPANEGAPEVARTAYIEEGMAQYEKGLRKKLIWLVYVIPMVVIAVTIYLINVQ